MTEYDDVIRLLEEGRPQATEMELDQIKQRVRRRAADPSGRKQGMKSRVAILGMLVTGAIFSTAGVGLAVSGTPAAQQNASVAQYTTVTPTPTPTCTSTATGTSGGGTTTGASPTADCTPTPEGGVLPAEGSSTPTPTPEGGVLPAEASTTPTPAATNAPGGGVSPAEASDTQPTRQAEAAATNNALPFTGFAAIPVILGGLALLSGGLLLRRRTRPE